MVGAELLFFLSFYLPSIVCFVIGLKMIWTGLLAPLAIFRARSSIISLDFLSFAFHSTPSFSTQDMDRRILIILE